MCTMSGQNDEYVESFLPLRFFLHSVDVKCASCNKQGVIETDIPQVKNQEPVRKILYDGGSVSFKNYQLYEWTKARFTCRSCTKSLTFDSENPMKTWYGPLSGRVKEYCPYCKENGYKRLCSDSIVGLKHGSKLKKEAQLTCPKCQNTFNAQWEYDREISIGSRDPIFGLELFLQQVIGKNKVWAYNREHLKHIKLFLSAKQRKIGFTVLFHRFDNKTKKFREAVSSFSQILLKWMLQKSNREKILNCRLFTEN